MPIERKKIVKPYLLLCEGRDAEGFLINYLGSKALAKDQRFSSEIQVLDFGGNEYLSNFLMSLKNIPDEGETFSSEAKERSNPCLYV